MATQNQTGKDPISVTAELRETMPVNSSKSGVPLLEGEDMSSVNMLLSQIQNQGTQKPNTDVKTK